MNSYCSLSTTAHVKDLFLFDEKLEPFATFARQCGDKFLKDPGIEAAVKYMRTKEVPDGFRWTNWEDPQDSDVGVDEEEDEEGNDEEQEDDEEDEEEEDEGGDEEGHRPSKVSAGYLGPIDPVEVISNHPATLSADKFDKLLFDFMEKQGHPIAKRPTLGQPPILCLLPAPLFFVSFRCSPFHVNRHGATGFQEVVRYRDRAGRL